MKKNYLNNIVFICFLLFSVALSHAEKQGNSETGKPLIHYFSPKIYKAGPRNWSIAQDNRGVMYFGNTEGILEYDGHNWRKIEVPGNKNVRSIVTDKNGVIYVCADTDFGYLEPDSFGELKYKSLLSFLDAKHKNFGEIWDVAVSTEGVFYKTRKEIFRWNGNEITVWDSVIAFRLYNIDDTIYSRNNNVGLMQIVGDSIQVMPDGNFFSSIGVYDMLPFKENRSGKTESILVTTNYAGLFIQKDNKFISFKTETDSFLIINLAINSFQIS
jgi:hypothetical protein